MTYFSQRLDDHHDVGSFDCSVDSLNNWLRSEALRSQRSDTARTYVWTETEASSTVVAYFSVAPTLVRRAELTGGQAGGQSFDIPGYLLAKLALDKASHGQGLGAQLLVDAISRMVGASDVTGGRLIVVDAIDEDAANFYRRHDFTPVKGNPHRLILKVATARKIMGLVPG